MMNSMNAPLGRRWKRHMKISAGTLAKRTLKSPVDLAKTAYRSKLVSDTLLKAMRLPRKRGQADEIHATFRFQRVLPVHVLLCPPGGGNIGDQAMVESFINNITGNIVLIVRSHTDYPSSLRKHENVEILALPSLVYGSWLNHIRDVNSLRRVLSASQTYSVVGADIMDGAYNELASVNRARTLRIARKYGLDTRVLGFSWNATPNGNATRELRAAGEAGAVLYARDPISAKRLRDDGVPNVCLVADTVFADKTLLYSDRVQAILSQVPSGKAIVLVNASGLVGKICKQADAYAAVTDKLAKLGHHTILLPHVIRTSGDDLNECKDVFRTTGGASLTLVKELLLPAEVRALALRSRLVVSGRMHLGVIALSLGVPAILVATQGKVEGLAKMFDISELIVTPDRDLPDRLLGAVDTALLCETAIRKKIGLQLDSASTLARLNFPGSDVRKHEG